MQASDIFAYYVKSFPRAEVTASSFEEYFSELEPAAPTLDLPVFSEEIGDSWIYGKPFLSLSPPFIDRGYLYGSDLKMRKTNAESHKLSQKQDCSG